MTLFLLNIQSTGGPEHVCRKRHPPLSSFSSLCLFPTYFCPPTVWDCPPTHPRFETLILISLNYIRTEKDLLITTSFLGGSWRKNGGGQGIPNSIHRAENCAQIKSLHYSHNYFHLDATDSKATHITRFIKDNWNLGLSALAIRLYRDRCSKGSGMRPSLPLWNIHHKAQKGLWCL